MSYIFCGMLIEWVCLFTLKWKARSRNWGHVRQKQYQHILNLAQDISHSVGCIPTAKHIGTALHD